MKEYPTTPLKFFCLLLSMQLYMFRDRVYHPYVSTYVLVFVEIVFASLLEFRLLQKYIYIIIITYYGVILQLSELFASIKCEGVRNH